LILFNLSPVTQWSRLFYFFYL